MVLRSIEKIDVLATGLTEIEPNCLRRAAREVIEACPEGPGDPTPLMVADELARLSHALRDCLEGQQREGVDFDPELIEAVRARLLQRAAETDVNVSEAQSVIDALDAVQSAHIAPEEESAVQLLSSPDGFQLVVEMAHDLRSPLSSILFLSDTLRRGQSGDTSDLQRKQLGLIYSAALGLASVVADVVELAKGGGTLRDESEQPFSIAQIVNTVLETVGPVAEEKGIDLTSEIQSVDHVRGFPISTSRVLLNLLTNALHHTSAGKVALTVRRSGRGEVEFSVEDTGSGIAEDDWESVFRPFKQSHGQRRMLFSGSGLGLSIARSLVEAMGGELDFDSEVGKGTRFWFRVPASPH